jgi:Ala-tRNA(Pro) deacylase
MATERELANIFRDCDVGAIPVLGQAYGLDVVMDDCLCDRTDIYFESGDHEDLIHMRGDEFESLMRGAQHGEFSRHI